MIVLDSNVLSAVMSDPPNEKIERWLDAHPPASVWTTSITVFELYFGIELLELGKRRSKLTHILQLVLEKLEDRIAPLDHEAARCTAELMAKRQKRGRPQDLRDSMIAGIVLSRKATLATRNTAHFEDAGIKLINPWNS